MRRAQSESFRTRTAALAFHFLDQLDDVAAKAQVRAMSSCAWRAAIGVRGGFAPVISAG
jgi:hypothetical protein